MADFYPLWMNQKNPNQNTQTITSCKSTEHCRQTFPSDENNCTIGLFSSAWYLLRERNIPISYSFMISGFGYNQKIMFVTNVTTTSALLLKIYLMWKLFLLHGKKKWLCYFGLIRYLWLALVMLGLQPDNILKGLIYRH